MQLKESGEMYLETIYVLSKKSNKKWFGIIDNIIITNMILF